MLHLAAALAALLSASALLPALTPGRAHADPLASERALATNLTAKLSQLGQQEEAADERYNQAQQALTAAQARQSAAQQAEARARADLAAKRRTLQSAAVDAYMGGGQVSALEMLATSSASDFAVQQSYLSTVVNGEQSAVDSFRRAEAALAQQEASLAHATQAAASQAAAAQDLKDQLSQDVSQEQATLGQVQGQVAQLVAQDQAAQAAAGAAGARTMLTSATGGGGGSSSGDGLGGGGGVAPPVGQGAGTAVAWAQAQIGKPYVYGAAGPDSFDCSGLTMYVWAHAGASLPHSAAGQWDDTTRVSYSQLQPGDLVFYYQPVDHVGIYVGNNTMIEAAHTGTNVRYASIFRSGLDGFGRVG